MAKRGRCRAPNITKLQGNQMPNKLSAAAVVLVVFSAGCTSSPSFEETGEYEETFDGLSPVRGTIMDRVWARRDIDLTGYSKIMLQPIGVEFRDSPGPYSGRAGAAQRARRSDQTEFALDEQTRMLFVEEISSAFRQELELSEVFTIVNEPGPDVLLIRVGLLDVVSRVPPETAGRSRIFIDRVGEATLVLEIHASESQAIFVRAVDRRAAERRGTMVESNRVTNRAEVRRLGRRWGGILRDGLDTLMTQGPGE